MAEVLLAVELDDVEAEVSELDKGVLTGDDDSDADEDVIETAIVENIPVLVDDAVFVEEVPVEDERLVEDEGPVEDAELVDDVLFVEKVPVEDERLVEDAAVVEDAGAVEFAGLVEDAGIEEVAGDVEDAGVVDFTGLVEDAAFAEDSALVEELEPVDSKALVEAIPIGDDTTPVVVATDIVEDIFKIVELPDATWTTLFCDAGAMVVDVATPKDVVLENATLDAALTLATEEDGVTITFWYMFKRLGPPQYSEALPEQTMLHVVTAGEPPATSAEPALITLPQ